MRLISARENGVAIDYYLLPDLDIPKSKTKEYCGEPKLRSNDEIKKTLDNRIFDNCTFSGIKRYGPRFSLAAQCALPDIDLVNARGSLRLSGNETPERIDANFSIDIYVQSPGGGTEVITLEYKRELTRLGDC